MKFVDRGGNEITDREWYAMSGAMGLGDTIAFTVLPHLTSDIEVKTVFIGLREADADPRPFAKAVLPYRTMRLLAGRQHWETLQTYDTEAAARAGHMQWCVRYATTASTTAAAAAG